MTVAELIEALNKLPNQNAQVVHRHCEIGFPMDVEIEEVDENRVELF